MTPEDANLRSGERRDVTVLFSDMTNFTGLSEERDPEDVDHLMGEVFGSFEECIRQYGGTVEKYIGDALVAVFGAPRVHEDDPIRAVNAALDFYARIDGLQRRFPEVPIAFRTGIHTGLITTGKRGDFEVVTGHTMSVASRLESNAPAGGILVSDATRDRCEREFQFGEPQTLTVKGKQKSVQAYQILGRIEGPDRFETPFVGREAMIADMLKAYVKHDATRTEGFFIIGDAGIGKTRLATEFFAKVSKFPDNDGAILFARARKFRSVAFSVIHDLLLGYLGVDRSADRATIVRKLVDELGTDKGTAENFAGFTTSGRQELADSRIFVVFYLILGRILQRTADSPYSAVLCIDNFWKMDPQSRDFFRFFLKSAERKPFFLLLGRKGLDAYQGLFVGLKPVQLFGLSARESEKLLESRTGSMPIDVRDQILEHARGNPLIIEEYVKAYQAKKSAGDLPVTIQNLFLATTEGLDPAMQELLKKLTVYNQNFTFEDARHLHGATGGNSDEVAAFLSFFQREGILDYESDSYHFRYDVFKKALYSTLLNFNKRILHRHVANRIRERDNFNTLRLIYHLMRAGDFEAVEEVMTGDPSHLQNMEYVTYLDDLLTFNDKADEGRIFNYHFLKSAILFNNGRLTKAEEVLKTLIGMALEWKNDEFLARSYHILTAYFVKAHDFQKVEYCGRMAVRYYEGLQRIAYTAQNVKSLMATSRLWAGDIAGCDELIGEMSHLSDGFDMRTRAMTYRRLFTGDYESLKELLDRRLGPVVDQDSELITTGYVFKLMNLFALGDVVELERLAEALLSAPIRGAQALASVHSHYALALYLTGRRDEAIQALRQAEFNVSKVQNDFDRIDSIALLAETLLVAGDLPKAAAMATEGLKIGIRHSLYRPQFRLLVIMAEIKTELHDFREAEFFLREAEVLASLSVFLHRRDRILYWYLRGRVLFEEESEDHARALLLEEEESLGVPARIEFLHHLRSFGRIAGA